MSISNALNNAVSGLTAASRRAEIVSSNTANAMTEGYARRELSLSSETLGGNGGGVRILGVVRIVDEALMQDKRIADAAAANTTAKTDFYARVEEQIGDPETEGSLSWALTEFESALLTASSLPDSTARLTAAVSAAQSVTDRLNAVSEDLQQARLQADQSIATQVSKLNETLSQVQELNRDITTQIAMGNDAASLLDERQMLVDQISEIVPVRTVQREGNQIALFTTGGGALLDGYASTIGYDKAGVMSPDFSLANGDLSGLTLNGNAVSTSESGPFGGGSLGAAFAVRDTLAPAAQAKLDAVARDLITRLESSTVDPTLVSGDAGLFTDSGNAFNAADEVGLAGRISLNARVDPAQGGSVWRLRDGMGAIVEGTVGDATILNALSDALTEKVEPPLTGSFGAAKRTASELASDLLSYVSSNRQTAELTQSYTTARQEALTDMALSQGVDTDYETQSLLVVEQAYSANAQVIRAINEMMQELLDL